MNPVLDYAAGEAQRATTLARVAARFTVVVAPLQVFAMIVMVLLVDGIADMESGLQVNRWAMLIPAAVVALAIVCWWRAIRALRGNDSGSVRMLAWCSALIVFAVPAVAVLHLYYDRAGTESLPLEWPFLVRGAAATTQRTFGEELGHGLIRYFLLGPWYLASLAAPSVLGLVPMILWIITGMLRRGLRPNASTPAAMLILVALPCMCL